MSDIELLQHFAAKISKVGGVIFPISDVHWTDTLENRLGFPLPKLYRLFLQSYEFTPFEIAGIEFFGSAGDSKDREDILSRMFLDRGLSEALIPKRMVHFGRPDTGSYDPICINLFRPNSNDGPIVRIDHEEILCYHRVTITQELFPSFRALIQTALDA